MQVDSRERRVLGQPRAPTCPQPPPHSPPSAHIQDLHRPIHVPPPMQHVQQVARHRAADEQRAAAKGVCGGRARVCVCVGGGRHGSRAAGCGQVPPRFRPLPAFSHTHAPLPHKHALAALPRPPNSPPPPARALSPTISSSSPRCEMSMGVGMLSTSPELPCPSSCSNTRMTVWENMPSPGRRATSRQPRSGWAIGCAHRSWVPSDSAAAAAACPDSMATSRALNARQSSTSYVWGGRVGGWVGGGGVVHPPASAATPRIAPPPPHTHTPPRTTGGNSSPGWNSCSLRLLPGCCCCEGGVGGLGRRRLRLGRGGAP